jgi:hypothetical protein
MPRVTDEGSRVYASVIPHVSGQRLPVLARTFARLAFRAVKMACLFCQRGFRVAEAVARLVAVRAIATLPLLPVIVQVAPPPP